ncbi:sporulation domain-containing protein [Ectothiorhodospira sp. PHS-1]|uniref:SPOR domain-containing protein n=1 Tax=Ectothiorhodospira sp. PHS-1 TaxID=519989 RepID=UPI00024A8710|nr:SPOR domain-containing protein [Ectothiorhodospira sp. PHS-1]EHQ52917.1 sporulation domain-containing protein [Ectothiorhodospira sp. PHS-1]
MRLLFFLLLLLNLAYLLYGLARHAPETPPDPTVWQQPEGIPMLRLLREGGVAAEDVIPDVGQAACVSLGPFGTPQAAAPLQARLLGEGLAPHVRPMTESRPLSYWVVLEPVDGRAGARAAITLLTARGMNDHYIITEGPHRDGLSLGLFSEHARALRRLEQVRGIGLEPIIETRYREVSFYWVDVNASLPMIGALSLELPEGVFPVERDCP